MKMSNETYDTLKWIAQIFLPALGTFLFTICSIFGWSFGDILLAVITASDLFLGSLLGISSNSYKKQLEED